MRWLKAALTAFLVAALAAATVFVHYETRYGADDYPVDDYYQYVSGDVLDVKNTNPEFISKNIAADSLLVFGSSELNYTQISTHPMNMFYNQGYDADFCLVGATGTQSLWAAMEIGSLSSGLENKKVVFIVSQQWFGAGGIYANVFQKRYSAKAMSMFLNNPDISSSTKQAVLARAQTLLSGSSWENQVQSATVFDSIDSFFNRIPDIMRIDKSTAQTSVDIQSPGSFATTKSVDDIDWNAWLASAQTDAQVACTNNDYGMLDSYYTQYCATATQGCSAGTDWSNSTEYDDLRLFLQVCEECNIEPLIIIQPVKGAWSDYAGISQETRDKYYQDVRDIADEYGVEYADFSAHEYDEYFLCDTMHLGWEGWVYVEKAVCDFYNQD